MIGYLRGKISHLMIDTCFVDVKGVGYRVFITSTTRQKLGLNQEITLYTYLNVREDAMNLYGFYTQNEYDLFLKLISVSGIGPKVALGIMSAITVENLCQAISKKNITILTKLPGIGKKSAERLILELYDKLSFIDEDVPEALILEPEELSEDIIVQTMQALATLGYTQAEFTPILRKLGKVTSVEEAIKNALKELARRS